MTNTAQDIETVRVSMELDVEPLRAFTLFTEDVDAWWARGPKNRFRAPWAGVMRFEPGVGGRLIEIYDEDEGDFYEVGRIHVWEPGRRLVFDWRIPNFAPGEITQVEIIFEPSGTGTRVTLEHRGWETLRPGHPARHGLTGAAFRIFRSQWWADHFVAIKRHSEGDKP